MTFTFKKRARGKAPIRGEMNKTEAEYMERLELMKHAGEILWYAFEPIKLRLAGATFYTPDFFVMLPDGTIEAHEVKGFWQDDARVKIKVAAENFPFEFIAVKMKGKKASREWEIERI